MSFVHQLNCDEFICSFVSGKYFHFSQVVPDDTAKSGIFHG
jgi:hypothetical protein